MPSVLCNDCACDDVACGRCICLHPSIQFPTSEKASLKKNNHCAVQDEDRQDSNFSTPSSLAVPIELMKTKMLDAAGFPATSKDKTSILFEDRLGSFIHIFIMQSFYFSFCLNKIRMLVSFNVSTRFFSLRVLSFCCCNI